MGEILNEGLGVLTAVFEVWLCYPFLYGIAVKKTPMGMKEKIIVWANIIFLGTGLAAVRRTTFFSEYTFLLSIMVTCVCIWLIQRKEWLLIMSVTAVYYSLSALTDFLLVFLSSTCLDVTFLMEMYLGPSSIKTVCFLVSRLIMAGIVWGLKRNEAVLRTYVSEYKKWLLFFGLVLVLIVRRYQFIVVRLLMGRLAYEGIKAGIALLLILLGVDCLAVLIFASLILKKENQLLLLKDEMLSRNYQEILRMSEESRRKIHDMRHKLMMIQAYGRDGEFDKLQQYLEVVCGELEAGSHDVWTGHRMLDFILGQKKAAAQQKNIEFDIWSSAMLKLPLSDGDISVLFGNLLDNAIEACERMEKGRRWIALRLEKQEQLFFIEITNSMSRPPMIKNGEMMTMKGNKTIHGYGMKSIERMVDKYGGVMSVETETDMFKINIAFFKTEI